MTERNIIGFLIEMSWTSRKSEGIKTEGKSSNPKSSVYVCPSRNLVYNVFTTLLDQIIFVNKVLVKTS